jgi:hypothetical protein
MSARRLVLVLGLLALVAPPHPAARAHERPARWVGIHRDGGRLSVSVGLRDLFYPDDGERLRSGFTNVVLIRVELVRDDQKQPVTPAVFRRGDIVFDLWHERFRVTTISADGSNMREEGSVSDAIERATALQKFPVTDLARLSPGVIYRLRFRADLNPLREEVSQDVRRWLARPAGQGRAAPGDSFFGSFVSFFVNPKVEESERQLSFWSQPFVARPVPEVRR